MSNTLKFGNGEWYGKEGTILAYNSENNNYKPLPFDFSRASSATRVNKDGLIETVGADQPRVDYLNDTNGALKLEPSRTNLLPYSSEINDTRWTDNYGGTGVEPVMNSSTELAKDGTLSACEWVFNTGSGTTISDQSSIYYTSIPTTVGVTYSFSVWVYSSLNNVEIQLRGAGSVYEKFTLTIGWNKITRIAEATSTSTLPIIGLRQSVNGTVNSNITVSLWGAQMEAGSYPTSIINTKGSAVTRLADVCSQTVPDGVIGQTEGTMFIDVNFDTLSGLNMFLSIRPNSSNKIEVYRDGDIIYGEIAAPTSFSISNTNITVGRYKIALAYSSGSTAMYINGNLISNRTTSFAFTSTLDEIYINSRGTSFIEQSNYNEVKLYNTRLSNSELAALTQV